MQNPFETGHIKNYILLYVSVVVIMILFFIAATLFRDTQTIRTKVFNQEVEPVNEVKETNTKEETPTTKFKLLEVNSGGYIQYSKD